MAELRKLVELQQLTTYDTLIKEYIKTATPDVVWIGTQAEYDAQKDTIPEGTFVIITDGDKAATKIIELPSIRHLFKEGGE